MSSLLDNSSADVKLCGARCAGERVKSSGGRTGGRAERRGGGPAARRGRASGPLGDGDGVDQRRRRPGRGSANPARGEPSGRHREAQPRRSCGSRAASAASKPFPARDTPLVTKIIFPNHHDSPSPVTTVRTGLPGKRVALHSHLANASARRTGRIHFHPFGPACKTPKCTSAPLPEEMRVINRTRSVNTVRRPADNRPDAGSAAPPPPGSW
jgi:hypothetical protein